MLEVKEEKVRQDGSKGHREGGEREGREEKRRERQISEIQAKKKKTGCPRCKLSILCAANPTPLRTHTIITKTVQKPHSTAHNTTQHNKQHTIHCRIRFRS